MSLILSLPAICQPTNQPGRWSAKAAGTLQVCTSTRQALKIRDSLWVLPTVRQEAAAWQQKADSATVAALGLQAALADQRVATRTQQRLYLSEQQTSRRWQRRARRRGLVNWLLGAAATAFTAYKISH